MEISAKYEVQQFPRLLDCYFQRYMALHFQILQFGGHFEKSVQKVYIF